MSVYLPQETKLLTCSVNKFIEVTYSSIKEGLYIGTWVTYIQLHHQKSHLSLITVISLDLAAWPAGSLTDGINSFLSSEVLAS